MSCPSELEPYELAYKLENKVKDESRHSMGLYFLLALKATVGNMFNKKGARPFEYPKLPFLQENKSSSDVITEHEKEMQVEAFFAREKIRRLNWKRNKKKEV